MTKYFCANCGREEYKCKCTQEQKEKELEFRKEIAKALKQERRYFGYSTKSVASFLKIDWREYSKMEKGEKSITIGQLDKIANLYGLNMKYFTDKEYRKKFRKGRKKIRWCGYRGKE